MNRDSAINLVITAAVVLVVLPLLVTIATMGAHIGLEMTGGAGLGMFGHMGGVQMIGLLWTVLTVAVVAALIGLLRQEHQHHHHA
jgi:hypothetical protein